MTIATGLQETRPNSNIFSGTHITSTQENECTPIIAKGQVETTEFGGGKWAWDIALPSTSCTENLAPTAHSKSVTTNMNTLIDLVVTGSHPEGHSLAFTVTEPAHGTLTGIAPTLTYTPDQDYTGPDGFTFKVNDGTQDSNIATVSITITNVNNAPIANSALVGTDHDKSKTIALTGSDPDGDKLVFIISTAPKNGKITSFNKDTGQATYTPTKSFAGNDEFKFKVNDGTQDGNIATVGISVINSPPLARAFIGDPGNPFDDVFFPGALVTLDGTQSEDSEDSIESLKFSWSQSATDSTKLRPGELINAQSSKATFQAPSVSKDTVLNFNLVVTDPLREEGRTSIKVTIKVKSCDHQVGANCTPKLVSVSPRCPDSPNLEICAKFGETITIRISCESPNSAVRVKCEMPGGPQRSVFKTTVGNPASGTLGLPQTQTMEPISGQYR